MDVTRQTKRIDPTQAERTVLDLILEGYSNKVIAYKLNKTENTVKVQMRSMFKKAGVNNRTELALAWKAQNAELPQVVRASPDTALLTPDEDRIIKHLAEAWNIYIDLVECTHNDKVEFMHGIHRLQEKVFARPAIKDFNDRHPKK